MSDNRRAAAVILVVEDEPLQRMMASDLVRDAGFEAVEAMDATEAIAILERRRDICVVFSDIDMPRGPDGISLARVIRDRWPPIETILTSDKVVPGSGDTPPCGTFFSKPYRAQDVIAAMRRMAGGATAR